LWLASTLHAKRHVLRVETTRNGVRSVISEEAIRIFTDMDFNRYYCRAVCSRAIEYGVCVSVCWADEDPQAAPEVRACEMWRHDPAPFRELLRSQPSLEVALNIPGGRRTGLSLFFSDPSRYDV
jgi:hypothetical protein